MIKKYTFQKLRDYALWYYFKYFPSNKKLQDKMLEKSWNTDLVAQVFESIKHLLNEEEIIITKIRLYLFRNKNLNYIKSKLLEKSFSKELIEIILEMYFLKEWKSLLNERYLKNIILNYKNKWKSKKYIKNKLIERQEDIKIVDKIIDEIFSDWEQEQIKKEIEKLSLKFDKNKIIEKLLRKGFSYEEIKKSMKVCE